MERAKRDVGCEADDDTQQFDDLVPAYDYERQNKAKKEETLNEQKESD